MKERQASDAVSMRVGCREWQQAFLTHHVGEVHVHRVRQAQAAERCLDRDLPRASRAPEQLVVPLLQNLPCAVSEPPVVGAFPGAPPAGVVYRRRWWMSRQSSAQTRSSSSMPATPRWRSTARAERRTRRVALASFAEPRARRLEASTEASSWLTGAPTKALAPTGTKRSRAAGCRCRAQFSGLMFQWKWVPCFGKGRITVVAARPSFRVTSRIAL